jgi:ribosomal protein L37AE/L43A
MIRLIRVNLMVYFVCRENTQRRLEFAVNTVLVMVPPPEKSSRRWKSRSTLNTDALSAERTRKLSFLFAFFPTIKCIFLRFNSVKRQATGIWKCLRCQKIMAGGAYVLSTSAAITARTAVARLRKTVKGETNA